LHDAIEAGHVAHFAAIIIVIGLPVAMLVDLWWR